MPGFNQQMTLASTAIVIIAFAGCWLTSVSVPDLGTMVLAWIVFTAFALPIVLYLRERGAIYLQESIATIIWAAFVTFMLGYPVTIAARLGMGLPLRDPLFMQFDHALGINVPAINLWCVHHHWFGGPAEESYYLLVALMRAAVFVPILCGRVRFTQQYITANVVAFVIGLPVFALCEGIGPWYGYHLPPTPEQQFCTDLVLHLRQPGTYHYIFPEGAICAPSFHVVWALLSAQALSWIKPLRLPLYAFVALIVFSTMSVGNHYFCDVVAGIAVSVLAMVIARGIMRRTIGAGSRSIDNTSELTISEVRSVFARLLHRMQSL